MKYIDADRLNADLDKWVEAMADAEGDYSDGVRFAIQHFIFLLASLLREQPEVDLDAEIDKFLYGTKFKRDCDGVHVPGVCMRDWKGKKYVNRDVTPDDMRKFAYYFIEIGKNARKEENK